MKDECNCSECITRRTMEAVGRGDAVYTENRANVEDRHKRTSNVLPFAKDVPKEIADKLIFDKDEISDDEVVLEVVRDNRSVGFVRIVDATEEMLHRSLINLAKYWNLNRGNPEYVKAYKEIMSEFIGRI